MNIDSMISGYEEALKEEALEALEARSLTVRIPAADVAFAQAVADHYHTSRASFLRDLIGASLLEVFNSLPDLVRISIGKSADEIYRNDMEKAVKESGGTYFSEGFSTRWAYMAHELEKQVFDEETVA